MYPCTFLNCFLVFGRKFIYTRDELVYMRIMKILSVRIDDELEEKLSFLMAMLKKKDKSSYIRQLLEKSLEEELIEVLCKQVGDKNTSAWRAAEIAGISLRKMMEELHKRNMPGYDEQAMKEDIEYGLS